MYKVNYGKEPLNFRLLALRMIRNIKLILIITLLGTLVFGGGYLLKTEVIEKQSWYETEASFKLSYTYEPSQAGDYCINEATWKSYIQMDEFIDAFMVNTMLIDAENILSDMSEDEIKDTIKASTEVWLYSDVHIPTFIIKGNSPEESMLLLEACIMTITEDFPASNDQIDFVTLMDSSDSSIYKSADTRPARAVILSLLVSAFVAILFVLIRELSDDGIWLYSTLNYRYGLKTLGTLESKALKANYNCLLGELKDIGMLTVSDNIDPTEVKRALEENGIGNNISVIPAPVLCPESCELMKEKDGILLVVRAGRHSGKPLEFTLEYLNNLDIKVTAALLYDADEFLIKSYYRLGKDFD